MWFSGFWWEEAGNLLWLRAPGKLACFLCCRNKHAIKTPHWSRFNNISSFYEHSSRFVLGLALVSCFSLSYVVKHTVLYLPRAYLPVLQWQCNLRFWSYSIVLALQSWRYEPSDCGFNKRKFWGMQSQREIVGIMGLRNNQSTRIIKGKPDKRMKGHERRGGMEEWRLGENSQEMREGLEEYQGCDGKRLWGKAFPEWRSLANEYEVVLKGVMHGLAWGQQQIEACNASTLLLVLWARKQKDFSVWLTGKL